MSRFAPPRRPSLFTATLWVALALILLPQPAALAARRHVVHPRGRIVWVRTAPRTRLVRQGLVKRTWHPGYFEDAPVRRPRYPIAARRVTRRPHHVVHPASAFHPTATRLAPKPAHVAAHVVVKKPVAAPKVPLKGLEALAAAHAAAAVHINNMAYERGRHSIILDITAPVTISTRSLKSPARLVVDIPSASLESHNRELIVKDDLIDRVRISQWLIYPPTVRVVIETAVSHEPLIAVQQTKNKLYITLAPSRDDQGKPLPALTPAPVTRQTPRPLGTENPGVTDGWHTPRPWPAGKGSPITRTRLEPHPRVHPTPAPTPPIELASPQPLATPDLTPETTPPVLEMPTAQPTEQPRPNPSLPTDPESLPGTP